MKDPIYAYYVFGYTTGVGDGDYGLLPDAYIKWTTSEQVAYMQGVFDGVRHTLPKTPPMVAFVVKQAETTDEPGTSDPINPT